MQLPLGFDHFLMDLTGNQHNECEALFVVVILELQIVEVSPVLDVLVKGLYSPAFLAGAIRREAAFQIPFYISGDLINESILTVFQDSNLIRGFCVGFSFIILVRDKPLIRNNGADAFIRFLPPFPLGSLME